jgi:hypothetical protein
MQKDDALLVAVLYSNHNRLWFFQKMCIFKGVKD